MLKEPIHQEDIKFLNIYASDNKGSKSMKEKLTELKGGKKKRCTMQLLEISIILFQNLKEKKYNSKSKDLNKPINQMELIDIDRTLF